MVCIISTNSSTVRNIHNTQNYTYSMFLMIKQEISQNCITISIFLLVKYFLHHPHFELNRKVLHKMCNDLAYFLNMFCKIHDKECISWYLDLKIGRNLCCINFDIAFLLKQVIKKSLYKPNIK